MVKHWSRPKMSEGKYLDEGRNATLQSTDPVNLFWLTTESPRLQDGLLHQDQDS